MSSKDNPALEPIAEFDQVSEVDARRQVNDWTGKADCNDRNLDFDKISEEPEGTTFSSNNSLFFTSNS